MEGAQPGCVERQVRALVGDTLGTDALCDEGDMVLSWVALKCSWRIYLK